MAGLALKIEQVMIMEPRDYQVEIVRALAELLQLEPALSCRPLSGCPEPPDNDYPPPWADRLPEIAQGLLQLAAKARRLVEIQSNRELDSQDVLGQEPWLLAVEAASHEP